MGHTYVISVVCEILAKKENECREVGPAAAPKADAPRDTWFRPDAALPPKEEGGTR